MWRRLRGPLAGLLALASCLGALALLLGGSSGERRQPRPAAPARSPFFGLVAEDAFGRGLRYRERHLRRIEATGVGLVRQTVEWGRIERSPGRYDFRFYDRWIADLARHGMRLLPILFDPPRFRSGAPVVGRRRGTYPPRRYADLGRFGAVLVRRYGPGGSFWRRHPELPRLPVRAWQVWNEPNLPVYWPPGPNAAQYVRLLRATGSAIKRADPRAEVLTAGMPDSHLGVPFRAFLDRMYRAGAARAFDTLAINGFARDAPGVLAGVRAAIDVASSHGHRPPVWITEVGWATGGPRSDFLVDEPRQARLIERTLQALVARRRKLRLRGVVYFNWRDSRPFLGGREFFGLHTGLLRLDGTPKPALGAFTSVVRGGVAERRRK